MIQAVFLDVDGTLLSFQTHKVSAGTLQALETLRQQGVRLFVSTGRHYAMLGALHGLFTFDGYVTLSGQYSTADGRVIHRSPMSPQAVEELVDAVEAHGFSTIFLEGEDIYINRVDDGAEQFVRELSVPMPPMRQPSYARGRELYQAVTFLPREREGELLDCAPHLRATRWHPCFLDVIPPEGGKDKGIQAVLDYYGIPWENTMAIGDGENDISMIARAGIGVAMGSASREVCQAADYVTGTVDEDGVVEAFRHVHLISE